MPENYRNSSENLAQGAKTGAQVAKQAANTVKNTVSAAGKAASGNLAGAALDLARDKTWRTVALFLVVTVLFSVFKSADGRHWLTDDPEGMHRTAPPSGRQVREPSLITNIFTAIRKKPRRG